MLLLHCLFVPNNLICILYPQSALPSTQTAAEVDEPEIDEPCNATNVAHTGTQTVSPPFTSTATQTDRPRSKYERCRHVCLRCAGSMHKDMSGSNIIHPIRQDLYLCLVHVCILRQACRRHQQSRLCIPISSSAHQLHLTSLQKMRTVQLTRVALRSVTLSLTLIQMQTSI